jgi:hypothetical protein
MSFSYAQTIPAVEPIMAAPSTAVLGLVAVILVIALALTLKALVTKKNVDPEEFARLWHEIEVLRTRSHRQASKITALMLRARLPEDDTDE